MVTVVEAALVESATLLAMTVLSGSATLGARKVAGRNRARSCAPMSPRYRSCLLTVALNCFVVPEETVGLSGKDLNAHAGATVQLQPKV